MIQNEHDQSNLATLFNIYTYKKATHRTFLKLQVGHEYIPKRGRNLNTSTCDSSFQYFKDHV